MILSQLLLKSFRFRLDKSPLNLFIGLRADASSETSAIASRFGELAFNRVQTELEDWAQGAAYAIRNLQSCNSETGRLVGHACSHSWSSQPGVKDSCVQFVKLGRSTQYLQAVLPPQRWLSVDHSQVAAKLGRAFAASKLKHATHRAGCTQHSRDLESMRDVQAWQILFALCFLCSSLAFCRKCSKMGMA